ncbi:MAG: phage holin family protein [Burkholderiales bacterium]
MARPSGDEATVIDALRRLSADLFGALRHRLELASIEVGEAGGRLVFTLVASIAALGLFGGAVVALSAWLAFALWPTLGHAVLGWIALAYALAGAGVLWWLRARIHAYPPLMAETLAELHNDAAFMRGTDPK